jgi:hypothetical protein
MVPQDSNDRISSIRLFGNAELVVYRDRDFGGVSQWFDMSEPDLRESGWNDTISSYRIETRGAFGNRGRGYGYGRGAGRGTGYPDYVEPTDGSLEWRGRVDDRVQLVIRGRAVQERTLSGTRYQDGRAVFTSGLPAEPVRVTVRTLAGRARSESFSSRLARMDTRPSLKSLIRDAVPRSNDCKLSGASVEQERRGTALASANRPPSLTG